MSGRGSNRLGQTGADPLRLVLVARDRLVRESLCLELAAAGCRIAEFDAVEAAFAHLAGEVRAGGPAAGLADGLVIDAELTEGAEPPNWPVPRQMTGLAGPADPGAPPLILLAAAGAGWASAGRWDAIGVVDSARPVEAVRADLLRRFEARAPGREAARGAARDARAAGRLEFREEGRLAFWRGRRLDLKDPELALLRGLADVPGRDLTYRRARALLEATPGRGGEAAGEAASEAAGEAAGEAVGEAVDPAGFRELVQRLIERFREVDPAFDQIVFLPGRGYRWDDSPPLEESPESGATARSSLG